MRSRVSLREIVLILATVLVGLWGFQIGGSHNQSASSDEDEVIELIRQAHLVESSACAESNLSNQAPMIATLESVWSHRTPRPNAVETLEAQWSAEATAGVLDREDLGHQIADIESALEAGDTSLGDATTVAELESMPDTTPAWDPEHSPFERRAVDIARCQDDLGKNGAIVSISDVVVEALQFEFYDDEVFASVSITETIQLRNVSGVSVPSVVNHRYNALAAREDDRWVLLRLDLVLIP